MMNVRRSTHGPVYAFSAAGCTAPSRIESCICVQNCSLWGTNLRLKIDGFFRPPPSLYSAKHFAFLSLSRILTPLSS